MVLARHRDCTARVTDGTSGLRAVSTTRSSSISNILMYVVLTLSWAIFSGPTGYISLAPAAFFGVGVYASALLSSDLPLPVVIPIGGAASFILAYLVGSLTLRLRGMYFTMFTFGLVELIRNLVHWWEVNITGTVGRVDHFRR